MKGAWLVATMLVLETTVPLRTTVSRAATGFVDRMLVQSGTTYRFEVYVPADYTADKAWPVLVDLHGNGAQGRDGMRQTVHYLAEEIRLKRSRFPLLVLFPQAAPGASWHSPAMQDMVMAELDDVIATFHCDLRRLYLSGFSMGGQGVYEMAARWPNRFAALVVISGFMSPDHDDVVSRIRGVPLKVFHGATDERVPVRDARQLAAALKTAGAPVEYIEYPHTHHGPTAEKTYADPNLMKWLLAQHRSDVRP
jgi:predicted peptidase